MKQRIAVVRAMLAVFWRIGVDIGGGFHLYLSQTLKTEAITQREYRLRTVVYAYRVGLGPKLKDPRLIRWEHNSRESLPDAPHPRDPLSWRKRVGVEPTILTAKGRINGFEGHEDRRIPFASRVE